MKIIILGYSGLIGNSILKNLIKTTSHEIICVGRDIKNKPYKEKRVKYFKWDFISFKKLNVLFLSKVNVIINCVGKTNNNLNNLEKINIIFIKKLLKYIGSFKFKLRLIHLSSTSVYGEHEDYIGQFKIINENTKIKINNLYSKSKHTGDILIKKAIKKNFNKNLSFTILRISNVFGGKKKSNLFNFVLFSLKFRFWIRSSNNVMYNFINVNDLSQAVNLAVSKLKRSKNKIYILSDDCKQFKLYESYQKFYKKKFLIISIPISFIKFLIYFVPLPKKIINFFSLISSKVTYDNNKIKKELNFNPKFSLYKEIRNLNE